MDWAHGLLKAGALFAVSGAYAAYGIGAIMWLGGWGVVPALAPVFGLAVVSFASEKEAQ